MREPFIHQLEGKEFLMKVRKAILADEMGLGKTFTTLLATQELTKGGVVICPASLKTNWAREILATDPEATVYIADAAGTYAYHEGDGTKWYVANYDIIDRERIRKEILDYMPSTLILDEAHYIKSASTIRTKAALQYAEMATNVFLLTGTPILNRPMELYPLLVAIEHPLAYTKEGKENWYGFAKKYCAAFRREFWRVAKDKNGRVVYDPNTGRPVKRKFSFLDTSGASNLDQLSKELSSAYLRRTKEVLGDKLPQKIIDNAIVELSPEHRKAYDNAWDDYMHYLQNAPQGEKEVDLGNIDLAKHVIEINKLKQAASRGKIPHVVEAVADIVEQGEKVIVFTQYKETLKQIVEQLKARKIRGVKLSGEDNAQSRQTAVDYFQNDESVKVFVANIKAGGVGLTLTAASTVLFADMEWTPALHSQAEDRAHRIGQHKLVNIHYYIAKDTIDEDIVELLEKKQQVITKILEGEAGTTRDITKDAIKRMVERAQTIHT